MPSQSAISAGVAPDRTPLGWLIAIPLGCLVLIQALLALTGIVPVLDGSLANSDAYMRLTRVLHLHDGGAWFDPREPRVNPPAGHVQHWTRPLDALLLAGAWWPSRSSGSRALRGATGADRAYARLSRAGTWGRGPAPG